MVDEWRDFTVVTKLINNVRVYMVLGDAVRILNQLLEDLGLASVYPKPGQMTSPKVIVYEVVSVYRLLQI